MTCLTNWPHLIAFAIGLGIAISAYGIGLLIGGRMFR